MEKKEFNIVKKIKFTLKNPKIVLWLIKCRIRNLIFSKFGYRFLSEHSSPPVNIFLYPTLKCNLFCKMCDIGFSRKSKLTDSYKDISLKDELSADKYEPFIKELTQFKPNISITGGEPLLYSDLKNLLYLLISKYKLTTSIITNGLLLEKNAEMLVDAGLRELMISIDGLDETVDKIRGVKGLFKKTVSGLEKVLELKKIQNSRLKIILNFTITPINVSELVKFVEFFSKYDIESITFFHMLFKTNEMISQYTCQYPNMSNEYILKPSSISEINPKDMDIDILRHEIEQIKTKYSKYKINFAPEILGNNLNVHYQEHDKFTFRKKCFMPWNNAYIAANGDVQTSLLCFHKIMGNILKEPFLKIWNNEEYKKLRKLLIKEGAFPVCSRCCNIF